LKIGNRLIRSRENGVGKGQKVKIRVKKMRAWEMRIWEKAKFEFFLDLILRFAGWPPTPPGRNFEPLNPAQ